MGLLSKKTSSGVFLPLGSGFTEYKGEKGNGSINGIAAALGYSSSQLYSPIFGRENKQGIICIEMEIFTRNIVFVLTDSKITYLTQKDIEKSLRHFSVTKEFTGLRVDEVLTDGINNNSLSVDYLSKVLKLKNTSRYGVFYSDKIRTYLYFTAGLLTDFQFDDGLFPYARHLKEVNKLMFDRIADLAHKYWPKDEFHAQREINMHCEAWANIPDALGNEFVKLHRTENRGVNLHMLRVTHYNYPINLTQFIEINNGRWHKQSTENDQIKYKCGLFNYTFDKVSETLVNSTLF